MSVRRIAIISLDDIEMIQLLIGDAINRLKKVESNYNLDVAESYLIKALRLTEPQPTEESN